MGEIRCLLSLSSREYRVVGNAINTHNISEHHKPFGKWMDSEMWMEKFLQCNVDFQMVGMGKKKVCQ